MLKSTEQQNYIYITKDIKTITINDMEVSIPLYVFRSTKRYRINNLEGTLEKQCVNDKCNKWFTVCKIENNSFNIINDESLIHFLGAKSGFSTYCRQCEKPNTPPPEPPHTKPLNINLPSDLKKYLKTKSYLEDRSLTNILIEILDDYAKENPINISFK